MYYCSSPCLLELTCSFIPVTCWNVLIVTFLWYFRVLLFHLLSKACLHCVLIQTSLVPRLSDRTKVTKGCGEEKAAATHAIHRPRIIRYRLESLGTRRQFCSQIAQCKFNANPMHINCVYTSCIVWIKFMHTCRLQVATPPHSYYLP